MTSKQRAILKKAFGLLKVGATHGIQLSEKSSLTEVRKHVADLNEMITTMATTLDEAAGAGAVLDRVKLSEAKPFSTPDP